MTETQDCFAAIEENTIKFLTTDLGREIFLHAGDPWAKMHWEAYPPMPGRFQGGMMVTDGADPAFMREQLAHIQRVARDIGLNVIDLDKVTP
jgi:hypothetical protein